jgi:hypothetical protein
MIVKKADILYRYDWKDRSDKDYCNDNLNCKDEHGNDCINYKKCLMQSKKLVLTKVTITKKSYWDKSWSKDKRIKHYNAVNLKNWREPIGNFNNASHYKTNVKIEVNNIDEWSKSELAALKKVNQRLKLYIKMIRKSDKSWYLTDKRNIKNFISLQEKLTKQIIDTK